MNEKQHLSKIEHYLLSATMNDLEPLNVLYNEAMTRVEGASLTRIIQGLLRLHAMGLVSCYFHDYKNDQSKPCVTLTAEELERHCSGRSEEQLRLHPTAEYHGEYEFEATPMGREEESRDVYDVYYP